MKNSVSISGVLGEIRTEHHSNNKSRVLPLDHPVPTVHLNLITLTILCKCLHYSVSSKYSSYRLSYMQFASATN
jgi:hypothetical protein